MTKRIGINKILIFVISLLVLALTLFSCGMTSQSIMSLMGHVGFEYEIDEAQGAVTITGIGTYKHEWIIIPEKIEGYPVTAIGDYAFMNNSNITTINFPYTLEYIGIGAFYNCTNLLGVVNFEHSKVTHIQDYAFQDCTNLSEIQLPNTVISIGNHAFENSGIVDFTFSNNLQTIGDYAFVGCYYMQTVELPNTLTSIGKGAFENCQSIEKIEIPSGVKKIEEKTFHLCNSLNTVVLYEGLQCINYRAFAQCTSLESIDIPSTVDTIGSYSFYYCTALANININNGVNKVDDCAFACSNASEIYVPQSVTHLGVYAFYSTSLQGIDVDENNSVYYSKDGAVYNKDTLSILSYPSGTNKVSFTIPGGIENIEMLTFAGTGLEILNIPRSVVKIDDGVIRRSYSLITINYDGTVSEWLAIQKENYWDFESAEYTIYCSDGQIAKDGTVTYN